MIPKLNLNFDFSEKLKPIVELKVNQMVCAWRVNSPQPVSLSFGLSGMYISKSVSGYSFCRNTYSLCSANRKVFNLVGIINYFICCVYRGHVNEGFLLNFIKTFYDGCLVIELKRFIKNIRRIKINSQKLSIGLSILPYLKSPRIVLLM